MRLASIGWIIATMAVTGCTAGTQATAPTARMSPARTHARVVAIENAARLQGVQVVWVNPPDPR